MCGGGCEDCGQEGRCCWPQTLREKLADPMRTELFPGGELLQLAHGSLDKI